MLIAMESDTRGLCALNDFLWQFPEIDVAKPYVPPAPGASYPWPFDDFVLQPVQFDSIPNSVLNKTAVTQLLKNSGAITLERFEFDAGVYLLTLNMGGKLVTFERAPQERQFRYRK
jgi:hypothetical protein